MWQYIKKIIHIYIWNILQYINKYLLYTYPLIEDCARCRDCGRNVHDFHVPDELWQKVIGAEGVWCYDCFCNKADEKLGMKWRMELVDNWYTTNYIIYSKKEDNLCQNIVDINVNDTASW